ncbi:hypothetical protein FOZ62_030705, partial [Perkinsus olseni]
MPQPYAWVRLKNAGGTSVSPRSGHTITATPHGFICYGGMDGRRNDLGNPAPNSDLYILKLHPQYQYEWQMVELDPSSRTPPGRTLHTATCVTDDEIFFFGGIHSATPYQCLNDGWILDASCMEWKKLVFKASQTDKKSAGVRRLTGLIEEVVHNAEGGGRSRLGRPSIFAGRASKI